MADETPPADEGVKPPPVEEQGSKPPAEPASEKGDIPYDRFTAVNDRMKAAEAKVKQNADDQEAVRVAALTAQGKHEELAKEEHEKNVILERENEEFRTEQGARHSALLEKLPDVNKKFVIKHKLGLNALEDYSEQVLTNGGTHRTEPTPDSPGGAYKKPDKPFYEWTKAEKKEWVADQDARRAAK